MAKKIVLKIECAGCGRHMGVKDGQGVTGVTSTLCPECEQIELLKLAQHLVKTKRLSWPAAKRAAGVLPAWQPYLAQELEKRMTFELTPARSDDAGQFIVKVFLDDQLLHSIWCDRVSVFAGKPPIYCLYMHGGETVSLTGRLMVVNPAAQAVINEQTRAMLGECVKIGRYVYEDNQLRVDDASSAGEGKDLHPAGLGRRLRRKV